MIHYNSPLTYQKDSKFIPVGINSIRRMNTLKEAGGYTFLHKKATGLVFNTRDLDEATDGDNILPVLVVKVEVALLVSPTPHFLAPSPTSTQSAYLDFPFTDASETSSSPPCARWKTATNSN
jgi:hypothetical protein